MRGWPPEREDDEDVEPWMTVGTGVMHQLVRAHEHEVLAEGRDVEAQWSDWEVILSAEYVQYVRELEFVFFACPSCNARV
jgi:hypothetical protein